VTLGREFQEVIPSDKSENLTVTFWTRAIRQMHTFFHHRPFCSQPHAISACRSWMALWAFHKQLSHFR